MEWGVGHAQGAWLGGRTIALLRIRGGELVRSPAKSRVGSELSRGRPDVGESETAGQAGLDGQLSGGEVLVSGHAFEFLVPIQRQRGGGEHGFACGDVFESGDGSLGGGSVGAQQ